ncbi:hypothetical protein [Streptomyces niveus]|uniref:hypothetical protein n=1 Tax=Streptomyces niveus TaxID=193462 RepID=UPI000B2CE331
MDTADSVSDVLVWRLRRTAYLSADDAWRPAAQLPRQSRPDAGGCGRRRLHTCAPV